MDVGDLIGGDGTVPLVFFLWDPSDNQLMVIEDQSRARETPERPRDRQPRPRVWASQIMNAEKMEDRPNALPHQAVAYPAGLSVRKRRLTSLFDGESKDVKVHGYWLAFPQHTTFLVVETDDITHLQAFLKPGASVTTCEITPVGDRPVAPPG